MLCGTEGTEDAGNRQRDLTVQNRGSFWGFVRVSISRCIPAKAAEPLRALML